MIQSAAVLRDFQNVQKLFRVVAALQLTTYLWPLPFPLQNGAKYDYIIVGGGTAGCVIANRLVEMTNVSVLLIEAGPAPPLESIYTKYFAHMKNTAFDWNLTSSKREPWMRNQQRGRAAIVQGRMLGGSSSLSHMIYEHGNPADYDAWASLIDDPSWAYNEVHRYFKKSEKLIDKKIMLSKEHKNMYGTNGNLKLRRFYFEYSQKYLKALKEMGNKIVRNVNAKNPLGISNVLFACGKRVRQSTAYSFLRTARFSPNLNVVTETLVTKIIFDEFNNAIGIEALTADNILVHIQAHREVILTAGVFRTPQLLMVSGVGPQNVLNGKRIKVISNLPNVGKNLQDHPICVSVFKVGLKNPTEENRNPHKFGYPQLNGYAALNDFETIPTYGIRAFIIDDPKSFLELCIVSLNFKHKMCDALINGAANHEIFLVLNHLSYPKSRGQVSINSNKMDPPYIELGLYEKKDDLEIHARSVMHFNRILNTTFFRNNEAEFINPNINCGKVDFGNLKYWKCYCEAMVTTLHNNVGSCAMGAVVDSNLLVKGVHRLRIADASIMPTIVSSSTLATVIMIAQKASDLIKDDFVRLSK